MATVTLPPRVLLRAPALVKALLNVLVPPTGDSVRVPDNPMLKVTAPSERLLNVPPLKKKDPGEENVTWPELLKARLCASSPPATVTEAPCDTVVLPVPDIRPFQLRVAPLAMMNSPVPPS